MHLLLLIGSALAHAGVDTLNLANSQARCELGEAAACRRAGDLTLMGSEATGADGATAGIWYQRGCELGDGASCTATALWTERGDMGEPDPARARKLFALACDAGDLRGCTHLGVRYLRGAEVDRDRAQAASWFGRGCPVSVAIEPDPEACREIGALELRGRDVPVDIASARKHLERGCDRGDAEGCALFSEALEADGEFERAAEAARRACDLGARGSCGRVKRLAKKAG